jgi:hypothetical protein
MRLRIALLAFSALACGAILLFARTAATQKISAPQSFYIVTHVFSDDLPSGYEEILQVTHQEKDVCVRLIRISLANRNCGGQLVRAAERILPNTALGQATGNVDLCSYSDREVASALKHAAPKGVQVIFDSATQDIVAKCGAKEIVLGLPYPEEVDWKALQRNNPRVRALWDVNYKIRSHAFGENFSFQNAPADKQKEFEELGSKLFPELVSGTFETGFSGYTCGNQKCDGNYLAWRLRGYAGPPAKRDPSTVELVNADALHLAHYDLPVYPVLAKQTRQFGEVRLKIFADPQTGVVKDVQKLYGRPILVDISIEAVKKWQFSPSAQNEQPLEATLKFTLCPSEN